MQAACLFPRENATNGATAYVLEKKVQRCQVDFIHYHNKSIFQYCVDSITLFGVYQIFSREGHGSRILEEFLKKDKAIWFLCSEFFNNNKASTKVPLEKNQMETYVEGLPLGFDTK